MNKAAFYDLDGTLLSCNLVTMHAYYARNDRSHAEERVSVHESAGERAASTSDWISIRDLLFNQFSFRAYRGMHRDRLIGLADDLFEVTLKPSIFPSSASV